jgi:signal transduction histidine kinase
MALITPPELDKPLPEEVVASSNNWLVRYRMYPVFSWPWFIGRLRLTGIVIGIIMSINVFATLARRSDLTAEIVAPALVLNTLVLIFLTCAGPLAACWVRSRKWDYVRESRWILAALALATLVVLPLNEYSGEYITERLERPESREVRLKVKREFDAKPFAVRAAAKTLDYSTTALLTLVLGGGLAYVAYRRERERLQAYARKRELEAELAARHEAELKLSVLQAQIEPHFLFNTLANLRSLINHEPPRAVEMVDKLVDYLRASIPRLRADGSSEQATLGRQLDAAASYLDLMKIRMGARLSFSIDSHPTVRDLHFPPLMLITLVENSIKHGLEPKSTGGKITIQAFATGSELRVSVADNGIGFGNSKASGTGIGLANIRTRLSQMYGPAAKLELLTAPPEGEQSGFCARIAIPLSALTKGELA